MNSARRLVLSCALVGFSVFLVQAFSAEEQEVPDAPAPAAEALASLTWLAGRWQGPMWGGRFEACYGTPEPGMILSFSELHRDDAVAFHEFEVWRLVGDQLRLTPYPEGKPAEVLLMTANDPQARKITFENPFKDYPTRIVYRRTEEDRLIITLSDPYGDSDKQEVFDLRRVERE